jgi:hypothetical protein
MENRIKITQFLERDTCHRHNDYFNWGRMLEHLESKGVKMISGDPTIRKELEYGRFCIWNCRSGWAVSEMNDERSWNHFYFNKGWKDNWCLHDWDDLENAINYVVDTEKMVSHYWDTPHNCRMIDDVMRLVRWNIATSLLVILSDCRFLRIIFMVLAQLRKLLKQRKITL